MLLRKELLFDEQAREKLLKGIEIVAKAVGSTLGPKGRNVAVDQYPDMDITPAVLHDGVSVARSINLVDRFEDMGARLVKDAALKTNEIAGDGTTTSTILAHAIVKEALKVVAAGENPMTIKQEIEDSLKSVLTELNRLKKDVKKDEEVRQVAEISSASQEIGRLVSEALGKIGLDGSVTVEEGKSMDTYVEYKDGMEIERGYLSPYFVTNQERDEAILLNPAILLTDKKLNYAHDLMPFLESFVKTGRKDLLVVGGEIIEEALGVLVVNKLRGTLNVVAIQAPNFGDRRIDELWDLATITGGIPLLEDEGRKLDAVGLEQLGLADKVIISREKTIFIGGGGKKEATSKRVSELKEQLKSKTITPYDRDIKEARLARLAGKVGVIHVGAATEVEMKEKKERVIDAVSASKAAMEEGIVAGGEVALLYASTSPFVKFLGVGGVILKEALKQPFKVLLSNSGYDYAEVLQKMSGKEYPFGVDVMDGAVKDLIKSGIIDPVKVTRSALENAVSVGVMAITTNCLIVDKPEIGEKTL